MWIYQRATVLGETWRNQTSGASPASSAFEIVAFNYCTPTRIDDVMICQNEVAVTMAVTMINPSNWLILWRWGNSSVAPRILCASNAPQRSSARAKHCSVEDLDGWRVVKCTSQSIDVNQKTVQIQKIPGVFSSLCVFPFTKNNPN